MNVNQAFDGELDNIDNETGSGTNRDSHGKRLSYNTIYVDETVINNSDGWFSELAKEQCGFENNCLIKFLGAVILLGLTWNILHCLLGEEIEFDGGLFKILSLTIVSYIIGQLVAIIKLPPLLGMLLTGILYRTTGLFNISGVYPKIVIILREMSLCTILISAGLGLDPDALLKLSVVVLRLALLPCLGEAFAVAVASNLILGFPILWGILLGFLLSAVSPAVVVPSLLSLKERGFGEDKNIATMVIGASSLDDITAISVFGVCLGMIFSQGDLSDQLLQGPKELLLGLTSGVVWGLLSSFFPNKKDDMAVFKRSLMIGGWGLFAIIGSQDAGYPGAGPLSCIAASLTASIFWKLQGWHNNNPVAHVYKFIWNIMQPVLFGLIGAEIDLRTLQMDVIGYGIAVILCGLVFRILFCLIAVCGTGLNLKERIFVNLAWIPKATVQAALASKALDTVNEQKSPIENDRINGTVILTIAVLSILITAPLGAIGVAIGGPLLLSKKETSIKKDKEDEQQ